MKVEKSSFFVKSSDGYSLAVYSFLPLASKHADRAPILVLPAMGVPGKFYVKTALLLANSGYPVYLQDLRGLGDSKPGPSKKNDFGYSKLIYDDCESVVEFLQERHSVEKVILLGHSLGGQLGAVYAGIHPESIERLVLVTTAIPYYKLYGFPRSILYFCYYKFASLISSMLGYFPGDKLGAMGRNARQLMKDWSRIGLTGIFRDSGGSDLEWAFPRVTCPVLSVSFTDDQTYAPRKPVEAFHGRMIGSTLAYLYLSPSDLEVKEVGHFGWMKNGKFSELVVAWLQNEVLRQPRNNDSQLVLETKH
ncbi:hypothetical protein CH373_06365 [Leptospira perolatii]|uniref:AB hydrolase-1 domain-containing protein n=1 Tax=Leptospira perolatii TaxID=2023191 RepID=A0A2M9ZNW7_9LEPT|nr:alpha/beta fold hydrolase [Leptospira perolatii]PJZ70884.1 hypothetical protein CH360_05095 [Leptospira perolatii]PJZ73780.1 hypothetical protein CH373_06365 [Leptospira perolatii]